MNDKLVGGKKCKEHHFVPNGSHSFIDKRYYFVTDIYTTQTIFCKICGLQKTKTNKEVIINN